MIVLDTSALIRFFTRDDETKAKKAKDLLESNEELLLIDAVLLELVFTLIKFYKLPKIQLLEVIKYLLSRSNIKANPQIRNAVRIFEEKNMSITDCLVVAYGEGNKIASFDDKLVKTDGVKSVWR